MTQPSTPSGVPRDAFVLGGNRRIVPVEICLGGGLEVAAASARAAREGGASRVELCSAMCHQGLSPSLRQVAAVAEVLDGQVELLAMLRLRPGSFDCSPSELRGMLAQLRRLAAAGATGISTGVLKGNELDLSAMRALVDLAASLGLTFTCHRAFDVLSRPLEGIDQLLELGVQRVLSAGRPWGSNSGAEAGLLHLQSMVKHAAGGLEVVVAGGVTADLAPRIVHSLLPAGSAFSLHAHGSVRWRHRVSAQRVLQLVRAAEPLPSPIR